MEPTLELIDSIYVEKVMRARRSSIEDKLDSGPSLNVVTCEAARAGIRAQNPEASPEEVERLLRLRFELARRLEEASN
jgi:hypothetical protein